MRRGAESCVETFQPRRLRGRASLGSLRRQRRHRPGDLHLRLAHRVQPAARPRPGGPPSRPLSNPPELASSPGPGARSEVLGRHPHSARPRSARDTLRAGHDPAPAAGEPALGPIARSLTCSRPRRQPTTATPPRADGGRRADTHSTIWVARQGRKLARHNPCFRGRALTARASPLRCGRGTGRGQSVPRESAVPPQVPGRMNADRRYVTPR